MRQSPRASSFPTEVWTLPGVAAVIEHVTGESHHPGHVWHLLRAEGWTPQRPAIRRTWAPRGQTPVLTHAFNMQRLSMDSVVAFRWVGRGSRCYAVTWPGTFTTPNLIPAVQALERHFLGHPVMLLWDELPALKSAAMATYLAEQRRMAQSRAPARVRPDLNPVEGHWSDLKGRELANLCPEDVESLAAAVTTGLVRVSRQRTLPLGLLRCAGLVCDARGDSIMRDSVGMEAFGLASSSMCWRSCALDTITKAWLCFGAPEVLGAQAP